MNRRLTAIIAAIFIMTGCTASDEPAVPAAEEIEAPQTETASEMPETTSAPEETDNSSVHLLAVGDNLIDDTMYEQAHRRAMGVGYDFSYEYANVKPLVSSADIAIINQETLICGDEEKFPLSDYPCFNSPADLGKYMQYMGFDIFTIANNHILDFNEEGLISCLDYWDSQTDAVVAGVYRNEADEANIRTFTTKGLTFSILSYTENTNGRELPASSPLIIGDAYDYDGVIRDIKAAKEKSDVCIVALHWGVEDTEKISQTQLDISQRFADAGADIIIGHHPHIIRDIHMIERRDGKKTLCAYSLGNFVSAQESRKNLIGGILEADISKNGDEVIFENVTLTPTIQHYEKELKNNRLYLYSQYSEELASQHGINSIAPFDMGFIDNFLDNTISEEFLKKD